ncbi:PAS domain-containing protein [Sphingopyxis sp. BSN-002]|uniref:PAS domain-containing protein n=1 Tax=Sphingopyxis sp. BSN-002 TaxID=2911495 RepID=UPI001EDBD70D|nr:PAS domain-containing protein [Sphingopyxis sp. BSN-002]UKK84819.1 PAS domain-containing protein [Sphingopyxis sp. BSN-002]
MASAQEPQRVSAADFIRGFASWRLQAARKPVVVTHHGKDAHVLISLDDYRRLDGHSPQADYLQASLPGLVDAVRDGIIVIDSTWRVAMLNPAASDMIERPAAALIGQELADVLPGLQGNLLSSHIHRLLVHRERFSGDIPSLLRPRQWARVDLIPVPVGGALIVRDISATMDDVAMNDTREATLAAMEAQGLIARASITVREMIEDANDALTALVGVDPSAIRRVRFSALLAMSERAAFAEALEGVFRAGIPARLVSALVTREGVATPVILTIAERRGAYASDGAVIVMTRA